MPTEPLMLIGAGGHARVVFDALCASGAHAHVQVRDDSPHAPSAGFARLAIETPALPATVPAASRAHVAIGNNDVRRRLAREFAARGGRRVPRGAVRRRPAREARTRRDRQSFGRRRPRLRDRRVHAHRSGRDSRRRGQDGRGRVDRRGCGAASGRESRQRCDRGNRCGGDPRLSDGVVVGVPARPVRERKSM